MCAIDKPKAWTVHGHYLSVYTTCSGHRMLARSGSVVLSGVAKKAVADTTTVSRTVAAGRMLWGMVKG